MEPLPSGAPAQPTRTTPKGRLALTAAQRAPGRATNTDLTSPRIVAPGRFPSQLHLLGARPISDLSTAKPQSDHFTSVQDRGNLRGVPLEQGTKYAVPQVAESQYVRFVRKGDGAINTTPCPRTKRTKDGSGRCRARRNHRARQFLETCGWKTTTYSV